MTTYPECIAKKQAELVASLKRDIENCQRRGYSAKKRSDWDKFETECNIRKDLLNRLDVVESTEYVHWSAIHTAWLECIGTDGMVVWQEMADYLGITLRELDFGFEALMDKGLVSIEHHEFAYTSFGVGYRGRREYQLVELRFVDPLKRH